MESTKVTVLVMCPILGPQFDTLATCVSVIILPIHFEESVNIMEGSSGSSYNPPAKPVSELETLQKQHEEKTLKIQELKRQIETVKLQLEKKKKKDIPDARKEAFHNLSEKYNSLREEYNALLAERSRE
ncbi:hypothetical protein QQP08_025726 [Theobroma cacao]|nr:hypothetical protein QQP08_024690 [Theobroma cacao]WRX33239.1 hypothetical protein QQP08_025726 [Theobroma cacao]